MKEDVKKILKKLEEVLYVPPPVLTTDGQATTAYIRVLIKVQIIQTMMIARFLEQGDEIQQQLLSLFQEENSV